MILLELVGLRVFVLALGFDPYVLDMLWKVLRHVGFRLFWQFVRSSVVVVRDDG
jgi:hypothetical protein